MGNGYLDQCHAIVEGVQDCLDNAQNCKGMKQEIGLVLWYSSNRGMTILDLLNGIIAG